MALKTRTRKKPNAPRRANASVKTEKTKKRARSRNNEAGQLVQARLQVGPANDVYEQEANRVAEYVVGTSPATNAPPSPAAVPPAIVRRVPTRELAHRRCAACGDEMQAKSRVQRKCAKCGEARDEQSAMRFGAQRAGDGAGFRADADTTDKIAAIRAGGGRPLPVGERRFFEGRMGYDFGKVRVHTGPQAVDASRRIKARAFTIGRDIVFGDGQYQPGTHQGRKLMAHELTHTVQQGATTKTAAPSVATPGSAAQPKISRMAAGRAPGQVNRFFGNIFGPSKSSKKKTRREMPTHLGGHRISDLMRIPSAGEILHTPRGQAIGRAVGRDLLSRYSREQLLSVAEKKGVVKRVEGGDFADRSSTAQRQGEQIQRVAVPAAGGGLFVVAKAIAWLAAAVGTVVAAIASAPLWVIIAIIAIAVLIIAGIVWYFTSLDDAPAPAPPRADAEDQPSPGNDQDPRPIPGPVPNPWPEPEPLEDPSYGCVCCAEDIQEKDLQDILTERYYGHQFNVEIKISYLPRRARLNLVRTPCVLRFYMRREPPYRGIGPRDSLEGLTHPQTSGKSAWNNWRARPESCSIPYPPPITVGPFKPHKRRLLPDNRTPIPGRDTERRRYDAIVFSGGASGGRPCRYRFVALTFDQVLTTLDGRIGRDPRPRFNKIQRP